MEIADIFKVSLNFSLDIFAVASTLILLRSERLKEKQEKKKEKKWEYLFERIDCLLSCEYKGESK